MGVIVLFGESYFDEVWVVEMGGLFLLELCGGIYVSNMV